MVGIDTNVLVRLLTHDDEDQYQIARELFSREQIYIPKTVMLETEWVLRYTYDFPVERIADGFEMVLGLRQVRIEGLAQMAITLEEYRQGLDFADALHLSSAMDSCASFATFDGKMSKGANNPDCRVILLGKRG